MSFYLVLSGASFRHIIGIFRLRGSLLLLPLHFASGGFLGTESGIVAFVARIPIVVVVIGKLVRIRTTGFDAGSRFAGRGVGIPRWFRLSNTNSKISI